MARPPRKPLPTVKGSTLDPYPHEPLHELIAAIEESELSPEETITLWIANPIRTPHLEHLAISLAHHLPDRCFAIYDSRMTRIIIRDSSGFLIAYDGCLEC